MPYVSLGVLCQTENEQLVSASDPKRTYIRCGPPQDCVPPMAGTIRGSQVLG